MKTKLFIVLVWVIAVSIYGLQYFSGDGSHGWISAIVWTSVACYISLLNQMRIDALLKDLKELQNLIK